MNPDYCNKCVIQPNGLIELCQDCAHKALDMLESLSYQLLEDENDPQ